MRGRKPDANAVRRGLKDAYALQRAGGTVGLRMPAEVAADAELAQAWELIAPPANTVTGQDMPILKLLVSWHRIASRAIADNDLVNLKRASSEIRALSDMLGLSPLARSRIGLFDATTVQTAAETAAIFKTIDAAYEQMPADAVEMEVDLT